jgi:hypothetical protein
LPFFDPFVSSMMRALLPPDVADSLGVPLRRVRDFAMRKALKSKLLTGIMHSMLNDWGSALVDQVMRDADDGMLVQFHEIDQRWRGDIGIVRKAARSTRKRFARFRPSTNRGTGRRRRGRTRDGRVS